jgi:uncharacterized membrane protein
MNLLVPISVFLAAGVEWVEALTIVLAVGLFKGWRAALIGTAAGVAALLLLVAVFGLALTSHVSIVLARTLVGVFLLLFGLKWLHKAILRSAGVKALHDEAAAFEETRSHLVSARSHWIGVSTAFNGVFLEGLEVVFIVLALSGLGQVLPAAGAAIASLLVVVVAGVVLREPLTAVPENAMKYVVGVMLTSFGTFFAGEGLGVSWWYSDASLLVLIAVYAAASLVMVALLRRPPAGLGQLGHLGAVRVARAIADEVWGLLVGDGALALVAVAVVLGVGFYADHFTQQRGLAGVLLVAGVLAAVLVGLAGSFRERRASRPASKHVAKADAVLPD